MPRYRFKFEGADDVKRHAGRRSARKLKKRIRTALEEGIHDMAEDSYEMAPRDTTALAQSIKASVTQENQMKWYYGSIMPYAQRQEYEHKSRRGYFRKSIAKNKVLIRDRMKYMVKDTFD